MLAQGRPVRQGKESSLRFRLSRWRGIIILPTNTMYRKKLLIASLVALALMGAGCSLTHTVTVTNTKATNTNVTVNTNKVTSVTYAGQTGKNALELLQSGHQVDVSAAGFVNAIDGVTPGDHQYWSFYVNGKQADVGAKDYQTKNSDAIEWKLESY